MSDFKLREDIRLNNLTASGIISDGIIALENSTISGDLTVDGELTVTGDSTFQQNLTVDGTITASNLDVDGTVLSIYDSVASMVADTALVVGKTVATVDYFTDYTTSELPARGGNAYEIVAAATGTDDGGSFIDLDNGLQAKGLFPNGVNVMQFGVKYAAEAGDRLKVQNAIDYVYRSAGDNYGGTVIIPAGVSIQVDAASLLIRPDVTLAGEYTNSLTLKTAIDDWLNVGALVCDDASYSVNLYNGSCLKDIVVMRRSGIDYAGNPTGLPAAEVANFAGTGTAIVESGGFINNVTYLGFATAINCTASTLNLVLENVNIDSTNGVVIDGVNAKLTNVNVLPYLSEGTGTESDKIRSGIGIEINSNSENIRLIMCSINQNTGIDIADTDEVTIEACYITHPTSSLAGTGINLTGTTTRVSASNSYILNHETGVSVDIGSDNTCMLANCINYNMDSAGTNVAVVTGDVSIDGGIYGPNDGNGGTGVTSASSASNIRISGGALFKDYSSGNALNYGTNESFIVSDEVIFYSNASTNGNLILLSAASEVELPVSSPVYSINGTTTITRFLGTRNPYGAVITFYFFATTTVQHGSGNGDIRLSGGVDFNSTAGSTLTLLYLEDNNFYEIARSIGIV